MVTSILPNMVPMRDITTISAGDKLFYELGHKRNIELGYGDNWIREGKFKQIKNIKKLLKNDKLMTNLEYLEHHNFMLIKKVKK